MWVVGCMEICSTTAVSGLHNDKTTPQSSEKPFRGDTKKEKCSAMRSENSCHIWPAAGLREMGSGGKGTSTESLLSHMRVLQIALCLSVCLSTYTQTHTHIMVHVMTHNQLLLSTQLLAKVV